MPRSTVVDGMSIHGIKLVLQDGQEELQRTCLRCGHRRPLSEFGLRKMTGRNEVRVQPLCIECRSNRRPARG